MRKLYRPIYIFTVVMKNGEKYTKKSSFANMRYSDSKDQYIESYSSELVESFCNKYCHYIHIYWNLRFKKYINFYCDYRKHIIKDIESITVSFEHKEISSYTHITDIAKELTYEEYLQFLFDKEQELKQAVTMFGK